jgi:2-keto-4-pentenoate hydratase/2-oxohepta-3-ene-1,7-dioic acid hydratase in catechol pathway
VNGELRQESNTNDLLFRMTELLEYLSMGRTVRKGTAIMTGTPSGIAAFMEPPAWLRSGDVGRS